MDFLRSDRNVLPIFYIGLPPETSCKCFIVRLNRENCSVFFIIGCDEIHRQVIGGCRLRSNLTPYSTWYR